LMACTSASKYFYPRPPRGGRLYHRDHEDRHREISIHALREEGDIRPPTTFSAGRISIHALREEGDASCKVVDKDGNISIHALREEGDM